MPNKTAFWYAAVGVCVFFVGVLGVFWFTELHNIDATTWRNYGIIVDAGSSGSRVYIRSWRYADGVDHLPIFESSGADSAWEIKVEPGMSTFANSPSRIGENFKPLLDFAAAIVPKNRHSRTPLVVMATAGMRMLALEERIALSNHLCAYVQENYRFRFTCDDIMVISGEMEGVYGWLTANYLLGSLTSQDDSKTAGFLDLGGASTQVAFERSPTGTPEVDQSIHTVELYDGFGSALSRFHVFSTSYLGYGANVARKRYLSYIVHTYLGNSSVSLKSDLQLRIVDPCLPPGLVHTEVVRVNGVDLPVEFSGTGDFSTCRTSAKIFLMTSPPPMCPIEACTFQLFDPPKLGIEGGPIQYAAVSEFFYTSHDVFQLGGIYSYPIFLEKAQSFCSTNWSQILDFSETLPAKPPPSRLQSQCFKSAWMVELLHAGYGFPENPNEPPIITTLDRHGTFDLSWSLGAMLTRARLNAPKSFEIDAMRWNIVALLVVLASIATLLGCMLSPRRHTFPAVYSQF